MENEKRDTRIAVLEARVKILEALTEDLRQAFKFDLSSTTEHFGQVRGDIAELRHYLMPALHTLFPGIAKGQREIEAILRDRPPTDTKKS